jgi:hypothetical protein
MLGKAKGAGTFVIGLLVMTLFMVLPLAFVYGSLWLSDRLLPFLFGLSWLALAVVVLVLLPLSLIRRTRETGLAGMFLASYAFGAALWLWGLVLTFMAFGWVGIVLGFFFMGIGFVPLGMLGTAVHGEWGLLLQMVGLFVLTFGCRMMPIFLEPGEPAPEPVLP